MKIKNLFLITAATMTLVGCGTQHAVEEQPNVEEPVVEDPVIEEPVVEEPVIVDPIKLTAANLLGYADSNIAYKDGESTVGGKKFSFVECAAYGNGIQMRTKNGKSSAIKNEDAFDVDVKKVNIVLNADKKVYANEHALVFTFNKESETPTVINWDTEADKYEYSFNVSGAAKTFELVHSITYSLYVDSIELIFQE